MAIAKNLLLLLQIVAASMLIAALADPALLHFGALSGDTVLVIDLSASMKAKGSSRSSLRRRASGVPFTGRQSGVTAKNDGDRRRRATAAASTVYIGQEKAARPSTKSNRDRRSRSG